MDVDIVVMWVDGSDPEWLAEKRKYQPEKANEAVDTVNRYRDWNLMKYWFRGVETYAPWCRKVHFVTWGHLPDFLDPKCEKLNIVRHEEFMPDHSLPTYNSMALELNLWRISGLAERFVFFNDDMFLTRPTTAGDYFDEKTGLPRQPFIEMPVRFASPRDSWQAQVGADVGVINQNFSKRKRKLSQYPGKYLSTRFSALENIRTLMMKLLIPEYYVGFKNFHSPAPFLLSTYRELWEKEPELLMETSLHRFRAATDINQWALLWWQLASGNFAPKKNGHETFAVNSQTIGEICDRIIHRKAESVCINDPEYDVDFEGLSRQLQDAFQEALPEKSRFEK